MWWLPTLVAKARPAGGSGRRAEPGEILQHQILADFLVEPRFQNVANAQDPDELVAAQDRHMAGTLVGHRSSDLHHRVIGMCDQRLVYHDLANEVPMGIATPTSDRTRNLALGNQAAQRTRGVFDHQRAHARRGHHARCGRDGRRLDNQVNVGILVLQDIFHKHGNYSHWDSDSPTPTGLSGVRPVPQLGYSALAICLFPYGWRAPVTRQDILRTLSRGAPPQQGDLAMPKITMQEELSALGQQVLALQGGGALGAYQAGVYEALHNAGIEVDWVIGTSIGAINAAIIAGNAPADRLDRLRAFWKRVEYTSWLDGVLPEEWSAGLRYWSAVMTGIPGFFEPNKALGLGLHAPIDSAMAGFYSVEPLSRTLNELVDFDIINSGATRLTVGASNVSTSEMVYFDSRDQALALPHIMASGALPPAFPPVRIGDDYFWDGGVLSNTPVETVFDDNPRRNSVIYSVHIWNPEGPPPRSMHEVMNRYKDVQYSSRSASHIKRQRQLHRLRHVITELASHLDDEARRDPAVRDLLAYGCTTRMHVIRLLAPRLGYEDHSKDVDFSPAGIRKRWEAGYAHTMRMLEARPWRSDADPIEGFVLHETMAGESVTTAAAQE